MLLSVKLWINLAYNSDWVCPLNLQLLKCFYLFISRQLQTLYHNKRHTGRKTICCCFVDEIIKWTNQMIRKKIKAEPFRPAPPFTLYKHVFFTQKVWYTVGHLEGWYLDPRSVHFFTQIQEFWTHTSIAGLSNSASAETPQRRIAWLLVMALMIAMSVCFLDFGKPNFRPNLRIKVGS